MFSVPDLEGPRPVESDECYGSGTLLRFGTEGVTWGTDVRMGR